MTDMNRHGYEQLIAGDIVELNKAMPPESLERQHIEQVLRWSVTALYGRADEAERPHRCIYDLKPDSKSFALGEKWKCPRCGTEWIREDHQHGDKTSTWSKVI